MAEGRLRAEWAQTSSLLCLLPNIHRDPKRAQAKRPGDFDPFVRRSSERLAPTLDNLKAVFFGGKTPQMRQRGET
jgi:hypothetical protein